MKIVQYIGGLGNQMFQHAFYLALRNQYPTTRADISTFETYNRHNGYELETVFGIKVDQAAQYYIDLYYNPKGKFLFRKLRRILGLKNSIYYEKADFQYDESIFNDVESKYYIGYWQNQQYFQSIEKEVREAFKFKQELSGINYKYLELISQSESVAIHVRRGDYVNHPLLGDICDLTYYKRALETICGFVQNPRFFVFSNDIAWCKENLIAENIIYVEGNTDQNSAADMHLMSSCKHQIIANSSFSWWAAWLNSNMQKIVVAPKRWINQAFGRPIGVIPQNWIQL